MKTQGATCERCGNAVPPGARFCTTCGGDVSGPQGDAATRQVTISATQALKADLLATLREVTLGEYEVLVELGSGGMASVFLAHDLSLDRKVAIKVMHPQLLAGEGMIERFKLEARTAAGLSHPNIIPIYAVKQEEDLLFFVMKFIEGRPLDSIIRQEAPLPVPMVRMVLSRVAEALGYAHRQGVIHRDIKPANIMVDTEGHPIVTDFGIAKVADKQGLTMTGAAIGTPTYMSPEQCHALPITGASDQYSLGVMAYEMLTGKPVFDGESVMSIMFKHVNEAPPPLTARIQDCPPDLVDTVGRMLAKKPEERFPSMEHVVRALNAPTATFDDPMRTRLVELAKAGENRKILQRISTPRSPMPSIARTRPRTRAGKTAPDPARTRPVAPPPPRPAGWRKPAVLGGVLVLAAAGGVLAVMQPWKAPAPSPLSDSLPVSVADSDLALGPPPDTAAPAPAVRVDTPVTAVTPGQGRPSPPGPRPAGGEVVQPPAVQTVRVRGPGSLGVGETASLQAEPLDPAGRVLAGHPVDWSSSAADVVSVTAGGMVSGLEAGRAVVTATVEGIRGSLTITVTAEAVGRVQVTPGELRMAPGDRATLTARVFGTSGRELRDRAVEWSSSAGGVASVSGGSVVAVGAGTAVLTAESGGQQASATVTVVQAGPTEADLRAQVTQVIQNYAGALESGNVSRVRDLFPGMTAERERQLRASLPEMRNLQVRLTVREVRLSGETATAPVTGNWTFLADGRRTTLPADNTYFLERRGGAWVITDIR